MHLKYACVCISLQVSRHKGITFENNSPNHQAGGLAITTSRGRLINRSIEIESSSDATFLESSRTSVAYKQPCYGTEFQKSINQRHVNHIHIFQLDNLLFNESDSSK